MNQTITLTVVIKGNEEVSEDLKELVTHLEKALELIEKIKAAGLEMSIKVPHSSQ